VNYLSQTYEGKRHDKKIADEENPTYPEDIGVYQDTGFQGYAPDGVKTFQPQKKPKGKEGYPLKVGQMAGLKPHISSAAGSRITGIRLWMGFKSTVGCVNTGTDTT
jgi:hypothetical protein